MKTGWVGAVVGAYCALGCGETRDLGNDSGWVDMPEAGNAAEPQTIYENEREHVYGLALDDTSLYALVEHNGAFQLVSCPVERCRTERTILYQGTKLAHEGSLPIPLLVAGEHLAWSVVDPYRTGIATCKTSGCDELTFIEGRGSVGIDGVTGDAEALYWTEDTALWRLGWGETEPNLVRELPVSISGDLVAHDTFIYYTDGTRVYRASKDGRHAPEVLADDSQIRGLTAGDDALYYTTETLTGRIVRCAWGASRCDEASLVAAQRFPSTVRQSAGELYWVTFPLLGANVGSSRLWSCSLPACDDVRERVSDLAIVAQQEVKVTFELSSRSVVWIEPRGRDGQPNYGSALRSLVR